MITNIENTRFNLFNEGHKKVECMCGIDNSPVLLGYARPLCLVCALFGTIGNNKNMKLERDIKNIDHK